MTSGLDVRAFAYADFSAHSSIDERISIQMHMVFKFNGAAILGMGDDDIVPHINVGSKNEFRVVDARSGCDETTARPSCQRCPLVIGRDVCHDDPGSDPAKSRGTRARQPEHFPATGDAMAETSIDVDHLFCGVLRPPPQAAGFFKWLVSSMKSNRHSRRIHDHPKSCKHPARGG